MTKIRSTKNALISAILVLTLSVSALLGTTFAWFTDSVTSGGNKIAAGNLKVDLELLDKESNTWKSLKRDKDPIFSNEKWEPGYTEVKMLKVENEGSLTLTWKATMVSYGEISELAEVIDVYVRDFGVLEDASSVTYPTGRNLDGYTRVGTAAEFLSTMEETTKGVLNAGQSAYLGLALKMREDAGNEYQGMSLGGTFDIVILATQGAFENDSFDDSYDTNASFPEAKINFTASKPVTDKIENGAIKEDLQLGEENSKYNANVPAGVAVADGADALELSITTITEDESNANITLDDDEEVLTLDVHMDGVAENNTVPMQITLKGLVKKGLNPNNIGLYHVEDGATVQMTAVSTLAELDAHNEFYYNAATGDVVLSLASFSEVAVVAEVEGHWDGKSADAFNGGTGTEEDPYLIANAAELAYFRDLVDSGESFDNEYVKLANNIFLNHEAEFSNLFDPIGWGYGYSGHNRNNAAGKVFRGTFDGDNYAIHGLWQNGWDLEDPNNDGVQDADYTYTNCGGGLFASVENATIKNLRMIDAVVTFECVEIGIVVGLAQGNCTFENISIYDSKIANYQRPAGGVVGEVSPSRDANGTAIKSTVTFKNIVLDTSVVVGSLWGDFDAPVGGVVGAYWDDDGATSVVMENVKVACELDVYNDVTSTYQWYAYRRAGMLIGNTDRAATDGNGRTVATADFLTCTDVLVYYTNWAKYNYCQFTNYNSSWPWVRVQAGENCSAYSNPRYGVPNDVNGNKVTGYDHKHQDGDQCNVLIEFNQLYGGGQGVYGQPEHTGVNTDVKYLITYMHDDHVADIEFITDNSVVHTVTFPDISTLPHLDQNKKYEWLNSTGAVVTNGTTIPAGNIRDIFYYLTEADTYYAHFVDKDGFYVAQLEFNPKDGTFLNGATAPAVPAVPGYNGVWEPYTLEGATHDVIINAVYSKAEIDVVMTNANALFEYLEQGKTVSMSQDLTGNFANASQNILCDLAGVTSRFDVNSYTLSYVGDSNGNKNWVMFKLGGTNGNNPAHLTVGDGYAGFGNVVFDLTSLNQNARPCIFEIGKDSTVVLERGVVIEIRCPSQYVDNVTAIKGVSNIETKYPGITVTKGTENGYGYVRITVNSRTVLVGE